MPSGDSASAPESVPTRRAPSAVHPGRELFWISVLALLFEMLVIRWVPARIGPVAYFSNLLLILAFLARA